jgi:hypothetical protein
MREPNQPGRAKEFLSDRTTSSSSASDAKSVTGTPADVKRNLAFGAPSFLPAKATNSFKVPVASTNYKKYERNHHSLVAVTCGEDDEPARETRKRTMAAAAVASRSDNCDMRRKRLEAIEGQPFKPPLRVTCRPLTRVACVLGGRAFHVRCATQAYPPRGLTA